MHPHFVNPHSLPDDTINVTRQDAFPDDGSLQFHVSDPDLITRLTTIVRSSLDCDYDANSVKPTKRLKTSHESTSSTAGDSSMDVVPFRLISSVQPPQPLILTPKPPPQLTIQEPDYEDDEQASKIRQSRAQAAAMEYSQIIAESRRPNSGPDSDKKLIHAQTSSPVVGCHAVMVLERDQPLRKTRPPVSPSELSYYPYCSAGLRRSTGSRTRVTNLPHMAVDCSPPSQKSHRRRRRKKPKERPQAVFWRPNVSHGGKGLGYAMGYPCSLSANIASHQYRRDTMKKAILSSFVCL